MPIGPLSSQPPEWKEPTGPVVPTGKSESFKLEKDDPWFNGFVDMLEKSGIFDDASKGKLEEIRKQVNGGQMSSSDGMNKIQTDFRAQCKDAIGKRIIDISDSYSQRLSDLGKACDQGDRDACIKHGHLQAYDNQIWGTLRDLNSGMLTPIQAWNELYNLGKPPYT